MINRIIYYPITETATSGRLAHGSRQPGERLDIRLLGQPPCEPERTSAHVPSGRRVSAGQYGFRNVRIRFERKSDKRQPERFGIQI